MSLIDMIASLTGQDRKDRGMRLSQLANSLSALEVWIEENVDFEGDPKEFTNELLLALNQGSQLSFRMVNKFEITVTTEMLDDTILLTKAMLVLKFIVAYDYGLRIDGKDSISYPDLSDIAFDDTRNVTTRAIEAINTISHLYKKYPY